MEIIKVREKKLGSMVEKDFEGYEKYESKEAILKHYFDQEDPKYKKTWVVHPVLVEVKTDKIRLDWGKKM